MLLSFSFWNQNNIISVNIQPIDELKGTDITDYAAEALSKSHIKDVRSTITLSLDCC